MRNMGKTKSKKKGTSPPTDPPSRNVSFSSVGTFTNYHSVSTRSDTEMETKKKPAKRKRSSSDEPERKACQMHINNINSLPSPVLAPLSVLDADEYAFFSMIKAGDTLALMNAVWSGSIKNMNINRFNKHGYTVLHVAVRRQDDEMVRILLQNTDIRLNDTILHAIREDNLQITQRLLEVHDRLMLDPLVLLGQLPTTPESLLPFGEQLQQTTQGLRLFHSPFLGTNPVFLNSSSGSPNAEEENTKNSTLNKDDIPFDSEFHQVITPLMLAAHFGSTQMMELFYDRGERLETQKFTHNMGCECDICSDLDGNGDLSIVHQRYHLYKALCQPEYICFMAMKVKVDPVNYAIDKIIKIRDIIENDKRFDSMYGTLVTQLETFCMDILGCCRTSSETEVFLSQKDTNEKERLPHQHPRLWYTVGLDLKGFVSHQHTQNIVYKLWATDDFPDWDTYGRIYRLFNLAIRIVAFPLIALILFIGQDSKLAKKLGSPLGRFLNYVASYIVFLILVGIQVACPYQRCNDVEPYWQTRDDKCKKRGAPNIGTEWPLVVYVLSYCVSMLKRNSVSWYWSVKWNWYDLCLILSFIATFTCWGFAWINFQMPENEPFNSAVERIMWREYSPEILGECFLAIATMFAYGRLIRFLQIFKTTGPLAVGIGKQLVAFLSTSFMYLFILFAFSSALLALYAPYKDYEGLDEHKQPAVQNPSYSEPLLVLDSLYWYIMYYPDPLGSLLTWDIPVNETMVHEVHHYSIQFVGKSIVVAYHLIAFVMMHQMLVGYFAQTMAEVLNDSETIWKFSRTEFYLTHVKDTVLPPPFNLIPTLKALGNALKFVTLIGRSEDPKAGCSFRQCCYITDSQKITKWRRRNDEYRRLILELILRYYKFRREAQLKEHASRDNALETKEEVTEIKEMIKLIANMDSKTRFDSLDDDNDDDSFDDFPPRRSPGGGALVAKSTDHLRGNKDRGGGVVGGTSSASNPVITTQPRRTSFPGTGISSQGASQAPAARAYKKNETIALAVPRGVSNARSLAVAKAKTAAPAKASPTQVIPEYRQTSTTNFYSNPPPEELPHQFGSEEYTNEVPSRSEVQVNNYRSPAANYAEKSQRSPPDANIYKDINVTPPRQIGMIGSPPPNNNNSISNPTQQNPGPKPNSQSQFEKPVSTNAFMNMPTPPRQIGLIGSPPPNNQPNHERDEEQNRRYVGRQDTDIHSPWNLPSPEESARGIYDNDSPIDTPPNTQSVNYALAMQSPPGFNPSSDLRKKGTKEEKKQSHFTDEGSPPPTPPKNAVITKYRGVPVVKPFGSFSSEEFGGTPPQSRVDRSNTSDSAVVPLENPSAGLRSEEMAGNPFGTANNVTIILNSDS
ncbi:Short transient receptor potential channel 5 [Orchesella cincta]|uniref:Short transient receptor potential channel 5 n=1 Tax=Orchesella cincta TaxID=48709 RepID=A0A1D2MTR7_ORCCI|nr:Short transient receptor potential channel 5 [Orchesella cincta]